MSKPKEYILKVGEEAVDRLQLLDEIYGPYTHAFFDQVGLGSDLSILDVGCGTGTITCWLAEHLRNQGKVTGVDVSAEQIRIAKERARLKNLTHVEFTNLSVYELDKLDTQFDIVFSRFLLIHLKDPERALNAMYDRLKPGGILMCDEQVLAASRCYPPSKVFNDSIQLGYQITQQKDLDYDFGFRLYETFRTLNLKRINMQAIQPILLSERHKIIWPMFLQEAKSDILATSLISETNFNKLVDGLMKIVKDKNTYILPMQNFQAWGIK